MICSVCAQETRPRSKKVKTGRDLQALRLHFIENRHDYLLDIAAWAQSHKSLSVSTVHHADHKCKLKMYHAKKRPYMNIIQNHSRLLWAKAHLK